MTLNFAKWLLLLEYFQEVQVYDCIADTELRVHDMQNEIDKLRVRLQQKNM